METSTWLSWQEAIGMAVQLMPGATIQWESDDEAVISIIVEPEAGHCVLRFIRARFYSTLRDHGWPRDLDYMFGPSGSAEHMSDRPVVAFYSEKRVDEQLIFADQISTDCLAGKMLRLLSGMLGHAHWASNAAKCLPSAGVAYSREPPNASLVLARKWEGVQGQSRWLHVFACLDSPCFA